ncbi:Sexual stage antigen s48/45 domain containing protein, putative [Hepatocystis sp. ex Piliocolobus tephrosceles]|nr:Sexual stage antigen s48/45 domain containing protein, putative [Hepatocystis sp. ex Piliocolobus tephrosceles]
MIKSFFVSNITYLGAIIIILNITSNCYAKLKVSACRNEFESNNDCYVDLIFGEESNIYCPNYTIIDSDNNNSDNDVFYKNSPIYQPNTCFNQMIKKDAKRNNKEKNITDLIPDLMIFQDKRDLVQYFYLPHYVPHHIPHNSVFSCYCIDTIQKKAYKLNIKIDKSNNGKKIKTCNFYYSDEEKTDEKINSFFGNSINLKYNKNCNIDGEENDVIAFKCAHKQKMDDISNKIGGTGNSGYMSVINVAPLACFHVVIDEEKNSPVLVEGLINGAHVLPDQYFYYKEHKFLNTFLTYLLLPREIKETKKIKCTCTIAEQISATSYTGTLSLQVTKNNAFCATIDLHYYLFNENEISNNDEKKKEEVKSSAYFKDYTIFMVFYFILLYCVHF